MTRELEKVARALVWWEPPEQALGHPRRFLAQVMTLGTWEEVQLVSRRRWDGTLSAMRFSMRLREFSTGDRGLTGTHFLSSRSRRCRFVLFSEIPDLKPLPGGIFPAAAT